MCYSIYLSTDCPDNLAGENFTHLKFNKDLAPEPSHVELLTLLDYPQRWFLNRVEYGGCSCHFRHSVDPTFAPPQDWMPEDEDDVSATEEAHRVFQRMVQAGYSIDVIDAFSGDVPLDEIPTLPVSLGLVTRESFRFFERYRFVIGP